MKVLVVHNRYRTSAPSGEDVAVLNEVRMLKARGVSVLQYDECNDNIDASSLIESASVAAHTIWSVPSGRRMREFIRQEHPDVVHVHNTFARLSPSIYWACKAEKVPVVQTLHNFRFFCPGGLFLRDGKPCEACMERSLLQSIVHRCYRKSVGATAVIAMMLKTHRTIGTYTRCIDRYITLTQFARDKAVLGGIPPHKIVIKPNFAAHIPFVKQERGGYVAYVGRLLEGKGAETLVKAWRSIRDIKLQIVGDGAMRAQLEAIVNSEGLNVEFLGMLDQNEALRVISQAEFSVVPSECYEGFPMVVAESFACGTPVLASRIGSLRELIQDGITGITFAAGDAADLARVALTLISNQSLLNAMRARARSYYEEHLTEQKNFEQLIKIYEDVICEARH